jgi:hypothetical protein
MCVYTFVVFYVNIETKNCNCSLKFTDESDFIVLSPAKRAHLAMATARHPAPYSQNLRWVDFTHFLLRTITCDIEYIELIQCCLADFLQNLAQS